jgi:hypothetical protein
LSVGFDREIRSLFTERDRHEMDFVLDLWSYDDVRMHAASILERLVDGTMPCEGPWPPARIALLRSWIAGGCRP